MMTVEAQTLEEALRRFRRAHHRRVWALAAVRLLWIALSVALALVYLDVILQLPGTTRVTLLFVVAGCLLVTTAVTVILHRRGSSEKRRVARMLELGNPELGNDLINAVEFQEVLAEGTPENVSPDLMGQEIDIASNKAAAVRSLAALRPVSLRREFGALAGIALVAVVLAFVFMPAFLAVAPRYLDPFGDHPPYCSTRFKVVPGVATVDYGADVRIEVETSGVHPDEVTLVVEDPAGTPVGELPMFHQGEGAFFQTIENVQDDLVYHARVERGRSKRFALTMSRVPRIASAVVTYDYPEYTHLESKTRLLPDPAELRAYAGTLVTLTLVSNRPLDGGTLNVDGGEYRFTPADDAYTVAAVFPLDRAGAFEARVVDIEGFESDRPFAGTTAIVPDDKPEVAIVSPGPYSFAIPDAEIPVVIEASDDLGVAEVALFRNLNGFPDARKALFEGPDDSVYVNVVETLDLGDLGVRPGDVIEVYATATDTRPSAPQTASTEVHQIQIIPFEAYRDFMQTQMKVEDLQEKYGDYADQLAALADRQAEIEKRTRELTKKLEEMGVLSAEEHEELADLARQQSDLARQTEELAKRMREEAEQPGIFDVEEEFKKALNEMADRLDKARAAMESGGSQMERAAGESMDGERSKQLQAALESQEKALEELGQSAGDYEAGIEQALEDMERIQNLLENVGQFKQLYLAQEQIERRARYYKDAAEPSLDDRVQLSDLGDTEANVQDSLGELRQAFLDNAEEIATDYPQIAEDARQIASAIQDLGIEDTMGRASEHLQEGDGPQGHPEADRAYQDMKKLIAFCEKTAGEGQSQCELRLKIQMGMKPGNSFQQMAKGFGAGAAGQPFGMGQGSGGMSGSSTPFDMYGSETPDGKPGESRPGGKRKKKADAGVDGGPEDPLSGNIEELAKPELEDLELFETAGEQIMEEYGALIRAYFERVAEEE